MRQGLFPTDKQLESRIAALDATLTPEELAAPTYLEWPDATLARSVRELAKNINDCNGRDGVFAHAGALTLIGMLKEMNAGEIVIKVEDEDGRWFHVTVSEVEATEGKNHLVN
jgi:hypothetical protein